MRKFFSKLFRVRIATSDDVPELTVLASKEGHGVFRPTLVAEKNERLCGWASINELPIVFVWAGKDMNVRDTIQAVTRIEDYAREAKLEVLCFPVQKESPIYPYMERFGYTPLPEQYTLFIRKV